MHQNRGVKDDWTHKQTLWACRVPRVHDAEILAWTRASDQRINLKLQLWMRGMLHNRVWIILFIFDQFSTPDYQPHEPN
jgi:hypothetical protein